MQGTYSKDKYKRTYKQSFPNTPSKVPDMQTSLVALHSTPCCLQRYVTH